MSCDGWALQAEQGPKIHKALIGGDRPVRGHFQSGGLECCGSSIRGGDSREEATDLAGGESSKASGRVGIEAKTKVQQELGRWKKGGKDVQGEHQRTCHIGKVENNLVRLDFGLEVEELR